MRISVSRSRAGASAFAVSNRSSASVHGPSFGRGWTSRSYENAVSPDRRIRRTVLRDRRRVREISLIDFPLPRCSRRIRPIVSTISIPHRPLRAKAGTRTNRKSGGQFWTPMTPLRGSILHAETHGDQGEFQERRDHVRQIPVIKLANEAVDQVRREEARNNFQIKGRRYIFLKNVDHLTQEEKEALSRLEAQNLDTIQAMQIRMNLQQLFTMSLKSARRFLDRWNAWVQICDLAPMK